MNFCFRVLKAAVLVTILVFSKINSTAAEASLKKDFHFTNDAVIVMDHPEILANDYLPLKGPWNYFKYNLVRSEDFYPKKINQGGIIVSLPHSFDDSTYFSSYHCRIEGLIPNKFYGMNIYSGILTCCKIWCNTKLTAVSGSLSRSCLFSRPAQRTKLVDLLTDDDGVLDIVIHVSNYELDKGGITRVLKITEKEHLEGLYHRENAIALFVMVFMFAIACYHIILGVLNNKNFTHFIQAAMCIMFCLLTASLGISLYNFYSPDIMFYIERRIYIVLFTLSASFLILYIFSSYKLPFRFFALSLYAGTFINFLVTLFIPIRDLEKFKYLFISISLFFVLIVLLLPLRFLLKRNLRLRIRYTGISTFYNANLMFSFIIFIVCIIDFLIIPVTTKDFNTYILFKISILFFGILQCGVCAFHRDMTNYRVNKYVAVIEKYNLKLSKFIPEQILRYMNADNITKIIPGECHVFDAMILYAEIKHFDQLLEAVEQNELFGVICDYYKEVAPVIDEYGGFIVSYMNKGFLSIFPERNESVIKCAARMQEKLRDVRMNLRRSHRADIAVGIVINTGKLAVGMLGTEIRLDSVLLSPAADLAVKIGGQSTKINARILITEEAMPYCRQYTDFMYDGHFIISDGEQILTYSAIPIRKLEDSYEDVLVPVEDDE